MAPAIECIRYLQDEVKDHRCTGMGGTRRRVADSGPIVCHPPRASGHHMTSHTLKTRGAEASIAESRFYTCRCTMIQLTEDRASHRRRIINESGILGVMGV